MADPDATELDSLKKEKLKAYEASFVGFELKAFDALERDFQEVLQELQQDRSLDHFRLEYEKLHRALKKSHESEKRLIKKCRELNTEILANSGKVQHALKLNEEDQNTILALKKEIDKAWKMVDASQEREEKAKDNIQQLKIEVGNLSQIIEQGTGLSIGQEKEIREATALKLKALEKTKEEAENQREELRNEIQALGREVEVQKSFAEHEQRRHEDLLRERDVLNKLKTQVEKERDSLKQELDKAHQQIKDAESEISTHVTNIENMNRIISEGDDECFRQKKELDVIRSERDLLGNQLIRRNEELALLYEKIKIQQSALSKGQVQYRCRLNELRLLKIKLAELKRDHCVLKGSVQNINVLKREVHNLNRELLQERTKVKALSEELENPLNVHRWRQLEGTDPSAYEMILKIQTLQKRLILKTEQVVEKDLLIQEKEKLYVELRSILARQPGPEVAEQLGIYAKNLKEKTRQMQAMTSELHMYQGQVKELKVEIKKLNAELDAVKLNFFEKKRKEQKERQKMIESEPLTLAKIDSNGKPQPKILGGGFNIAVDIK